METMTLRNTRALVTGGAGLIGSHIVDRLVDEGAAEIVVLDDLSRGRLDHLAGAARRGRVTFVEGDICDSTLVGELMQGIDVVFHQAAIRITQCAEEPAKAVDVLVNGTARVLEAAVAARVRKVVAASSASVYGMADVFPTSEDHHPYNNRTLYGAGKVFLEGILRAFNDQYGLDYVALRYFNVYGPRMDTHGAYTEVFIRWMEEIENGRPPVIFGDGLQTMDFVFVEDVARANILAAKAAATDRVYNVATGAEVSLRECAEKLLRTMNSPLAPKFGPVRKVNPVPRRIADTRRAAEDLGFVAAVPFDEGLAKVVAWWRGQRKGVACA
jgi:nucleoside-diphosphate-sugar epimerase